MNKLRKSLMFGTLINDNYLYPRVVKLLNILPVITISVGYFLLGSTMSAVISYIRFSDKL